MAERPQLPLIQLQGGGSRSCIIPGLMDHWKKLLDRRLAWIRHHRDNPIINPDVDTSNLITGVDGLPTCENLPPPSLKPSGPFRTLKKTPTASR